MFANVFVPRFKYVLRRENDVKTMKVLFQLFEIAAE
jgi:hypothetical protein